MVDDGQISYPYSTRELVNIVRHMQQYPQEGISRILQNVFDFDQYEREVKDLLIRTLQKHGIPVGLESDFKLELGVEVRLDNADPCAAVSTGTDAADACTAMAGRMNQAPLPLPMLVERWRPAPPPKAERETDLIGVLNYMDLPRRVRAAVVCLGGPARERVFTAHLDN